MIFRLCALCVLCVLVLGCGKRIGVNDQLLDAISAYVGVPQEDITDVHLAYLLRQALSADKEHVPGGAATRPMYDKAIEKTYERHQPVPRRPGESK